MQQCSQLAYQLALISQITPSGVIYIISVQSFAALMRYVCDRSWSIIAAHDLIKTRLHGSTVVSRWRAHE